MPPSAMDEPLPPGADKHLAAIKTRLNNNIQTRKSATAQFREQLLALVDGHKKTCHELCHQQSELLNEAYQYGTTAYDMLGVPGLYEISNGTKFLADTGNMVVAYWPKSALVEDSLPSEVDLISSERRETFTSAQVSPGVEDLSDMEIEADVYADPTANGLRKRKLKTYSNRASKPLPTSKPIPLQPTGHVSQDTHSTGCKDSMLRLFASNLEKQWSEPLSLTLQPSVKREKVMNKKVSWIFSYTLEAKTALYVMSCPANCPSPMFSKHPLCQSRASEHLRKCCVTFESEEDMIRKYAQQVVKDRQNRIVKLDWAREHNAKLLENQEKGAELENFC